MERSKRTCKAIALLQLFSLREFNGSRTRSLKVPRAAPRKTAAGALHKATQPTSAVHNWHFLVTKVLEPKRIVLDKHSNYTNMQTELQLAGTCAHDALTCMCTHIRPSAEAPRYPGHQSPRRVGWFAGGRAKPWQTRLYTNETHPTRPSQTKALGIPMPARTPSFSQTWVGGSREVS